MERENIKFNDPFHSDMSRPPQPPHHSHHHDGTELHLTNSRAKQAYTPGPTYTPSQPPPPAEVLLRSPPIAAQHTQAAPPTPARHPTGVVSPPVPYQGQGVHQYIPPIQTHPHGAHQAPAQVPAPVAQPMTMSSPVGSPQAAMSPTSPHGSQLTSPASGESPVRMSRHKDIPYPIPHTQGDPKLQIQPPPKRERKRDAKDGGIDDHAELALEGISKVLKVLDT